MHRAMTIREKIYTNSRSFGRAKTLFIAGINPPEVELAVLSATYDRNAKNKSVRREISRTRVRKMSSEVEY